MNQRITSISVEPVADFPAVHMCWGRNIDTRDVYTAFDAISRALDASDTGLYVIMDFQNDPIFPLTATLNAALFGPFRDPRLLGWLAVGANPMARTIGRTLTNVTRRDNIRWFNTGAEAFDYMVHQTFADVLAQQA